MGKIDKLMPQAVPYSDSRTPVRGASSPPAAAGEIDYADCASTANVASLSGTPAQDGQAIGGKRVLLWKQSTAAQNGLYSVSAGGVWSLIAQPKIVFVLNGTTQGKTYFVLTAANTYSGGCAYYG